MMSKNIKILAILGQVLFAWIYSSATNFCDSSGCSARSYISFGLILIIFAVLDWQFLNLYQRFKNISKNILTAIVLLFPVAFYFAGLILNSMTRKPISVIIIGLLIIILSRVLWMFLARGKFLPKVTEYLALVSFFALVVAIGFLAANLNFAISSYLKYHSPYSDIYITGNKGNKVNFINYKFR